MTNTSLALYYNKPESPLEIKQTCFRRDLAPREILVAVSTMELTHFDAKLKRIAQLTRTKFVGRSFCGNIIAVGSAITDLQVGNRVCGCFRSMTLDYIGTTTVFDTSKHIVFKAPEYLNDSQAACFPLSFGTAWELAFNRTPNLTAMNQVLILGGGTPIGFILTQIVQKLFNLNDFTVACSAQHVDAIRSLGISRVLDSEHDLANALVESVGGEEKFTVIYDCVGGYESLSVWPSILKSKQEGGMYFTIRGDAPKLNKSESIYSLIRNAAPYVPRNIARLAFGRVVGIDYHFVTWKDIPTNAVDYAHGNELLSLDHKVWDINDAQKAFEHLQSLDTGGRVVIDMKTTPRDTQELGSDCIEEQVRYREYLNYPHQARAWLNRRRSMLSLGNMSTRNVGALESRVDPLIDIVDEVLETLSPGTPMSPLCAAEGDADTEGQPEKDIEEEAPCSSLVTPQINEKKKFDVKKLFKKQRTYPPYQAVSPCTPDAAPVTPVSSSSPHFSPKKWLARMKKTSSRPESTANSTPELASDASTPDSLDIVIEYPKE